MSDGYDNESGLRSENIALKKRIEQQEKLIPKWVSVSERLPEDTGLVLVWCADGSYDFAYWTAWTKQWLEEGHDSRITHWMPLPQTPEGV